MASKRSVGSEQDVKGWQLEAVELQVAQHDKLISKVDGKLDDILKAVTILPTVSQVEDKIEVATINWEQKLNNAIEKQDLKYSPIVGNNKWLLRALVGLGFTLLASLAVIIVGLSGK